MLLLVNVLFIKGSKQDLNTKIHLLKSIESFWDLLLHVFTSVVTQFIGLDS